MPAGWVADYSAARPGAAALVAAGCVGVIRYMDPGRNDGTEITADELADLAAHGLPYGLVMEYAADWLEGGYAVGHAAALAAKADEQRLGIPPGVTYMASDFDIQPWQYAAAYACIQGAADAYGGWQYVGVYGSRAFCEWVGAAGTVKHFWSTDAWSNYTPASNAALHQHANWPANVPNVPGCDHNLVIADWAPRTGDDLTPEQDNILRTTARAVVQLAGVVGQLTADEATRANLLRHGDATHYSLDKLAVDVQAIKASLGDTASSTPVDPQPIVDGVVAGVKAQFAKAAQ